MGINEIPEVQMPEKKEQLIITPDQPKPNGHENLRDLPYLEGTAVKPEGFPGTVHNLPGASFILSKLEDMINWSRANSLWPLVFGTSCCAIEMMSTASAKYDWSRFGFEVARATPRQADVIIIAGTIVYKMAPVLKRLYDQMADPKYVIAMGACSISGGPFFYNTYSVVKGADHVIPVDVYIPGCPPRPEALIESMLTLQKKIKRENRFRK